MTTASFPVGRDTGSASLPRQHAARLAASVGFDETGAGEVALVTSELATNVVKHAQEGHILLRELHDGSHAGVEVIAVDRGPGLGNLHRVVEDGYSTAGSMGAGLGAVRRIADTFEVFSQPDTGSVAVARLYTSAGTDKKRPRIAVAGVSVAMARETVCGDDWDYVETPESIAVLVADGLGHGMYAAEAALMATRIFRERTGLSPADLLGEIHVALRATRGAAIGCVLFDRSRRVVRFAGVGNISTLVLSPSLKRHTLASHNGTAGVAVRRVQEFTIPAESGSTLVMHSDGLASHWDAKAYGEIWRGDPALAAAALFRDHARGRDDCTVVTARL